MSPKKPLTFAERARRHAEGSRFYVDKARELLEELSDVKESLETYQSEEPGDAVETVRTGLEALAELASHELGVSEETQQQLLEALGEIEEGLPDSEALSALADALETCDESCQEVEQQRDDPGSYDKDEREQTRDQAREAFDALAEALEALDPTPAPALARGGESY